LKRIKIIAVPDGEAPLHVREAWVGCVIPIATDYNDYGLGVLTNEPTEKRIKGFVVLASDALNALLERNQTRAHTWWTQNYSSYFLGFEEKDCELLVG